MRLTKDIVAELNRLKLRGLKRGSPKGFHWHFFYMFLPKTIKERYIISYENDKKNYSMFFIKDSYIECISIYNSSKSCYRVMISDNFGVVKYKSLKNIYTTYDYLLEHCQKKEKEQ